MRLIELLEEERATIEGEYYLNAQMDGYEAIQETYKLRIIFPDRYPRSLPQVTEIGNRIPRNSDHHTYENGSFCLGSEIKLKSILFEHPSIIDFIKRILDPFLYAISYKLRYDLYPYGELDHGEDGLIDDYQRFFNVADKASVLQVLRALGMRKREANKLLCPCGCGQRIGKCDFRFKLQRWRRLERRHWFREHLSKFTLVEVDRNTKLN
ncbi:MAG TPA: hypothetical protein PK874_11730 [Desulfobacteraceae bacterium]|nr:hypothetical protein [Desulfobacteraceae bacterium]HPJ67090.1 hypothetical protein [Desulfobacteraceae bacterium]HPQ29216.1 hypothetical protein [Desulfobacteraceae bacterium]